MRHYQPFADWRDEEIARLKRELRDTRYNLLGMVRSDIADDIKFPRLEIKTRNDLWNWRREITAKAIELAKPNGHGRAPCPLCGEEGNSFYAHEAGYLVPGGLERHLEGRGNVTPCPVMQTAWWLHMDNHEDEFAKADQAEREAKAHRLATEPVLRCDPDRTVTPDLFTKEGYWAKDNRTPEELIEAEAKLEKVGFKKEVTGNVVSYCLMQGDDWIVLADPRERGKVTFHVYKRSGKKTWNGLKKYPRSFDVRDNRKDWSGVFREGLGEFTGRAK